MFSQRPRKNNLKINLNNFRKFDCKTIEPLLWRHAANQLQSDDNARVLIHLAQCDTCCQSLEAYRQTVTGITALRGRQVPTSLTTWHTLQARLATETKTKAARSESWFFMRNFLPAGFTIRSSFIFRLAGSTGLAAAFLLIGIMTTWHNKPDNTSYLHKGKHESQIIGMNNPELSPANSAALLKPYIANPFLVEQRSKERPNRRIASVSPLLVKPGSLQPHTIALMFRLKANNRSGSHFTRRSWKTYSHGDLRKSSIKNSLQVAASKKLAWTLPANGMEVEVGQAATDFVLTTVEDNRKTQTNYVMDSVDTDTQNAVMQAKIESSNRDKNMPTSKEMQGW